MQWSIDFRPQKFIFVDRHLRPDDFTCELILSTKDDDRLTIKLTLEQFQFLKKSLEKE